MIATTTATTNTNTTTTMINSNPGELKSLTFTV